MDDISDVFEDFNYEGFLMIKVLYDNTGIRYNMDLDSYDDEINYNMIQEMLYHIYEMVYWDYDYYCNLLLDIIDPSVTKFYKLCQKYNNSKQLDFQNNPYVAEFRKNIEFLGYNGDLNNVDGQCSLTIIIDNEDAYDYVGILKNLLLIRGFLKERIEKLDTVLYPTVEQSIPVPERSAA